MKHRLTRLLALSREAVESAQSRDWGRVAELDAERRPLARELFAVPPPVSEHARIAAVLREIIDGDAALMRLAERARSDMLARASGLRRRQRAARAYAAANDEGTRARKLPPTDEVLPPAGGHGPR